MARDRGAASRHLMPNRRISHNNRNTGSNSRNTGSNSRNIGSNSRNTDNILRRATGIFITAVTTNLLFSPLLSGLFLDFNGQNLVKVCCKMAGNKIFF